MGMIVIDTIVRSDGNGEDDDYGNGDGDADENAMVWGM